MEENPFRVFVEKPLEDPTKYIGYEEQKEELAQALKEPGVTLVLADGGFGKSSMLRTMAKLGNGIYVESLSKDEIYSILKQRQQLFDRLLGKTPGRKISMPLFVDECGTLGDPELHTLLTNLYDNGTKIVMALNFYEKNKFNDPAFTIFDRKSREIILDGFSEEEIQKFVEQNGNGRFNQDVIDYFKNNKDYRKPRQLAIECYNLWTKMTETEQKNITMAMVTPAKVMEDRSSLVSGKKSKQILDFISIHPGCARKEIVTALALPPNSASNLIRFMKQDGIIRQDEKGRYYANSAETQG